MNSRYLILLLCICTAGLKAQTITADFETQITSLLKTFPEKFESLKGEKEYQPGDSARFLWKSKVNISGAAETYITKNLPTDKNLSLIIRFESIENTVQADSLYNLLVQRIKNLKLPWCTLTATEGKQGLRTYTNFTPAPGSKVQKGYENLVIQVKSNDHNYGSGFHFYSIGVIIYRKE